MRLHFGGVVQRAGRVTSMSMRHDGNVYQIDRVIDERDEVFRASIEEHMFLELCRDIYHKEIKT
ncbi:hypothetical protein [Xanthomonas phage MUD8-T1]|uniref:Uncharacterized protein n=1 Tax=Xanthomonas phage MUD8-T1 TaxID=2886033 RepID=A0AAE8YJ29_9CAUD|nr:hypothetical protein [Xanthomonas phage MUD8-T1]UGL62976.1 hypothetical protein [Xanthomonas phage R3-22-T1]